jgi:homoserine dehydrogenase
MRRWRLILIGFGTVGRGFADRLVAARQSLRAEGCEASVSAVIDPLVGSVWSPEGLDPGRLAALVDDGEPLSAYPGAEGAPAAIQAIETIEADVVVELTPTHIDTGEPALAHIRAALEANRHVITTNKGPIALAYDELTGAARSRGLELRFEGTVLSGTPLLSLRETGLSAAGIRSVRGVLNGTCNYILSEMERGASYAEALAAAQACGFAEADPAADVEGWDVAAKLSILAHHYLDSAIPVSSVQRTGITGIGRRDLEQAAARQEHLRLVGELRATDSGWQASVAPRRLASDDPLATVVGASNAVTFETEALGPFTVTGPGAGRPETGQAVLADLLTIHRLHNRR